MAIGEMSGIVQDKSFNILYRVTLNTLGNLTAAGLTQDNTGTTGNTAQKAANTRLSSDTPKGILGGSVVAVDSTGGSGYIVAASGANRVVGVAENNAVGYPYESSSGVASGKLPYLCGSGSVFATDLYETRNAANSADIAYAAGNALYTSANGLLTNQTPTAASIGSPLDEIVGILLVTPSASDPFMVVQMRI